MKSRGKAIATAIAVGLATTLVPTAIARAADGSQVQDLRREVSQLRADVQSLQLALADLADATEQERQLSVNLARTLEASAAPAESSVPAAAPAAPPAPTPKVTSGESKIKKSSHHRRHRHSSRARSRDR
jgi:peptidoglycan hydrolase CwlO-like protein